MKKKKQKKKQKRMLTFQVGLLAINVIVVMFISIFIYVTTKTILYNYDAREFLDGVVAIPWRPFDKIWQCALLLLALILSFVIREFVLPGNNRVIIASLSFDMAAIFGILYLQDFNYNGILLLVFANIIFNMKSGKGRFFFIILAIISFLMADNEMLGVNYRFYSIDSYIRYYNSGTQQYLFGFYRILESLNIILFVSCCMHVITEQKNTIDEVNTLYTQLEQANEQLHEYASMTEKVTETRERNRLAREIHDSIGHVLTGIAAGLDACIALIDNAPEKTKEQLEVISNVTREGIKEVRRSVNELRPDALERFSLEFAIQKMISDMTSASEQKIYFASEVSNLKFDEDEEMAIYRVIQEGITNAIRHGKADKIWIVIKKEQSDILLQIRDNGIGCENIKSGFGTRHIRERIGMLGGKVTFDGSNGFVIDARIPIRWGEMYD